jgi:hypothetical protein
MSKISLEDALVNSASGELNNSAVVRGVIKKDRINQAKSEGKDFYYIDTGYLGNFPSRGNPGGKKIYHRVVKNELQHTELRDVPGDRWKKLIDDDSRLIFTGRKNYDKKVLLVMPNPKACRYYDIDYDSWVSNTEKGIKKHTDLPIEVRVKGSRTYRNREYSIYDAFDSGVYATVCLNSIAALESILYGIPAFVSVPCAASPLANNNLENLSSPFFPDAQLIEKQCHNISYGQFTVDEITNGSAWKIIKKHER